MERFLNGKQCCDGAGNNANRKISKRRFSSLVLIFSQLKKIVTLELIKVEHFVKKMMFGNTKFNVIHALRVHPPAAVAAGVKFVHA